MSGFTTLSAPLTIERAADIAVADARYWSGLPSDWRLFAGDILQTNDLCTPFLGHTDDLPGILTIGLFARPASSISEGRLFALYQFDASSRKIVRRDFITSRPRGDPLRTDGIAIQGVLRNLPGYILGTPDFLSRFTIWAEANGRVVATETQLIGTTLYRLSGIPVTAGSVTIKAKIRGYDLATLHPAVVLNPSQPAGVIAGIDVDFSMLQPIQRDVRLIVKSDGPGSDASFPGGARARVYASEVGQSVDVVSNNGWAEAMLTGIPTGWPLSFFAVNTDHGNFTGKLGPIIIPEDGGSVYTDVLTLH
ncbi:MAG: hypothetical protein HQM09_05430 [Candidatus Riflebacteria bacterium]|nr:hypothetical protein [Candidatus Riflebacteria bacterium]